MNIFPFTVYGENRNVSKIYHLNRPKDESWYDYDTIVTSSTNVTFVVYDMKDSCFGGRGEEIRRINCTVTAAELKDVINSRINYIAEEIYEKSLVDSRNAAVKAISMSIRDSLQ